MLPIVKHPSFTYVQSDTNKTITFRPMVNAEFKSIITAVELGEQDDAFRTTLSVVKTCSGGTLDEKSANHHIEECFVKIYAKSVEDKTDALYTCNNMVEKTINEYEDTPDENGQLVIKSSVTETVECKTQHNIKIPVGNAEVIYPEEYNENKRIYVADDVYINMKSTSSEFILQAIQAVEEDGNGDKLDALTTYNSVESIEVNGKHTPITEVSEAEFTEWCKTLPVQTIVKMSSFIKNPPYIQVSMVVKCPTCGSTTDQTLKGLSSFFMF